MQQPTSVPRTAPWTRKRLRLKLYYPLHLALPTRKRCLLVYSVESVDRTYAEDGVSRILWPGRSAAPRVWPATPPALWRRAVDTRLVNNSYSTVPLVRTRIHSIVSHRYVGIVFNSPGYCVVTTGHVLNDIQGAMSYFQT